MMGLTVLLLQQCGVEAVFCRVVSAACAFQNQGLAGFLHLLSVGNAAANAARQQVLHLRAAPARPAGIRHACLGGQQQGRTPMTCGRAIRKRAFCISAAPCCCLIS